ncbi:hypothetical protein [Legionella hackeliae]|uniref:Putative methyltransferase n=1 Tax=Legionella hackeliae TaxID=449 RepID=A0A0A8UM48_LEGHA|nr:hypothetical protein [Legionella hackeliae]KTD10329.1 hypothetical protein Lhac_2697 [Legionella hackeliae]CEK09828.1 putative methyltransferase [Legionella hackeliae]STX49738.1 Uncharacterised protein [Legionella hackeliae]
MFAQLLNDALVPRNDSFLYPFPASFLFYDVQIDPSTPFLIKNKQVTKLRLMYQHEVPNFYVDQRPLPANAACYIRYESGEKEVLSIAPDKLQAVHELFKKHCIKSVQFFSRMNQKSLNWDEHSMDFIYKQQSQDPGVFYAELHSKIISGIEFVAKREQFIGINIIDGGCGNGGLLKKIESQSSASLPKMKLLGFDFNPENINDCLYDYYGQCIFIEGNLLKIEQLIKIAKEKGWINPDWPIFLILSGSLTRLVLTDGFQAANVLMKASATKVNYLIGGGVGEPLVTPWVLKHVGYKSNVLPISEGHHFFSYQQQSPDEFSSAKLSKLQKTNILDLALAPEPVKLLDVMASYLKSDSTIDLSFLPLTPTLIDSITAVLQSTPTLKLTFWHPHAEVIKQFLALFFFKVEVSTKITFQDANLLSSHRFYSLLKTADPRDFLDYDMANDLIFNYFHDKLSLKSSKYGKSEITHLNDLLTNISMPTVKIEETDDERALIILPKNDDEFLFKKHFAQFVCSLEKKILAGKLADLPILIFWYRKGINIRYQSNSCYEVEYLHRPVSEIQLYSYLAKEHSALFESGAMRLLAKWTISTQTKPETQERKEAIAELESSWPSSSASLATTSVSTLSTPYS